MRWERGSLNPLHALSELRQIVAIYRSRQPDLVHHVALKPSLLGSVASVIAGRSPVVNNLAGLGQAFSAHGISASAIRPVDRGVQAALQSFPHLYDRREF